MPRPKSDLRARLYAKIDVRGPDECWPWKARTHKGYAIFTLNYYERPHAIRVAWALEHGPIPKGLEIDHLCDNRLCCNPAHGEAVTHSENMKRAWRRGRHSSNHPDFICPAFRACVMADPRSGNERARIYNVDRGMICRWAKRGHLRALA